MESMPIEATASGRFRFVSSPGYRIQAGRVDWLEIPSEGLSLGLLEELGPRAPRMLQGRAEWTFETNVLEQVADIATRLTPWAVWWCGPLFFGCQKIGDEWAGYAWGQHHTACILTCYAANHAVSTAYHEAFHLADYWLSRDERMAMDEAVMRGLLWPTDYLRRPFERRARLFEHWAMKQHEAPAGARAGRLGAALDAALRALRSKEERVMEMVLSGELGRRVASRGLIPADRMPDTLALELESCPAVGRMRDTTRAALARWHQHRADAAILAAHQAWDAAGDDLDAATAALGRLAEAYRAS